MSHLLHSFITPNGTLPASTCTAAEKASLFLYSYQALEPRTRSVQNPQTQEYKKNKLR